MSGRVAGAGAEAQRRRTWTPESRCTLTDPVLPLSSPGTSWYQHVPTWCCSSSSSGSSSTGSHSKKRTGSWKWPLPWQVSLYAVTAGEKEGTLSAWEEHNYLLCRLPVPIKLPPRQIKKVVWVDLSHTHVCTHLEALTMNPHPMAPALSQDGAVTICQLRYRSWNV